MTSTSWMLEELFYVLQQSILHRAAGNPFILHFWSRLFIFFYCTWDKSRIATLASKVRYYLPSAWVPRLMIPIPQPQLSFCFWNTPSSLSLGPFNLPGHLLSRHGLVDNFSFPHFQPPCHFLHEASFGTPCILLAYAFLYPTYHHFILFLVL